MSDKTEQINFCLKKIIEILDCIRPGNTWDITYGKPEDINLSEWNRDYLGTINGDDYFFISIGNKIHYAVNVTGDSTLTAIYELMDKLSSKF